MAFSFSLTLFAVSFVLTGLWLWVVARWTGLRFPVTDILITAAVCNSPVPFAALGARLVYGWALGLIILVLIATRVEDADLWPELALMVAGTLVIWYVTYSALLAPMM